MYRIVLAAMISSLAIGPALAQGASCQQQAVGSDGKALAGAAKTAFLKKCRHDACEPKAVDKNGKPLAGAAKASFLKKCEAGA